jgi:hypothetical protein
MITITKLSLRRKQHAVDGAGLPLCRAHVISIGWQTDFCGQVTCKTCLRIQATPPSNL